MRFEFSQPIGDWINGVHCIYSATFSSCQCPADYEEEAVLGTRMKGTLKLAANLKQVVIRERSLT